METGHGRQGALSGALKFRPSRPIRRDTRNLDHDCDTQMYVFEESGAGGIFLLFHNSLPPGIPGRRAQAVAEVSTASNIAA